MTQFQLTHLNVAHNHFRQIAFLGNNHRLKLDRGSSLSLNFQFNYGSKRKNQVNSATIISALGVSIQDTLCFTLEEKQFVPLQ